MTRFTICDDEPEHGRLIGKYIKIEYAKHVPETDTAEVVIYQSPQEMLDEAIEDTDIFILDIECGKSSGLDIAKEIRRLNKNAGIVFCTVFTTTAGSSKALCTRGESRIFLQFRQISGECLLFHYTDKESQ